MKNFWFMRMAMLGLGVWLASTRDAAAYIDPGTGSYLFQILIAGLTALVFFFSAIRRKVMQVWKQLSARAASVPESDPNSSKPVPPKR